MQKIHYFSSKFETIFSISKELLKKRKHNKSLRWWAPNILWAVAQLGLLRMCLLFILKILIWTKQNSTL